MINTMILAKAPRIYKMIKRQLNFVQSRLMVCGGPTQTYKLLRTFAEYAPHDVHKL